MDLTTLFIFPFFLVFVRVSSAVMVFPAFSDPSINTKARLLASLGISMALWPLLTSYMPALPPTVTQLAGYVVGEFIIGMLMAISARVFMSAINIGGELIAFATGFQAATLFDPSSNSNSTAPTIFLSICAGVLVFATGLHHVLIKGIVESYTLFPPGQLPPLPDTVSAMVNTVQHMFVIGLKIAAPVVSIGFLSYVMFGIFNRLIPQLHVFFVAMPLNITVGLFVMASAVSSMLILFMTELHENAILLNQ